MPEKPDLQDVKLLPPGTPFDGVQFLKSFAKETQAISDSAVRGVGSDLDPLIDHSAKTAQVKDSVMKLIAIVFGDEIIVQNSQVFDLSDSDQNFKTICAEYAEGRKKFVEAIEVQLSIKSE